MSIEQPFSDRGFLFFLRLSLFGVRMHPDAFSQTISPRDIEPFFRMTEEQLRKHLVSILHPYGSVWEDIFGNVHFTSGGEVPKPMLMAHMDTVQPVPPTRIVWQGGFVRAPGEGLGADNRAGVYGMVRVIQETNLPLYAMFTTGEETGGIGARRASVKEDITWLVAMDRDGRNEVVFYDMATDEFKRRILDLLVYHKEAVGTWSDIATMAHRLNRCGVNLNNGGEGQHTKDDTLDVGYLEYAVYSVKYLLANLTGTWELPEKAWWRTLVSEIREERPRRRRKRVRETAWQRAQREVAECVREPEQFWEEIEVKRETEISEWTFDDVVDHWGSGWGLDAGWLLPDGTSLQWRDEEGEPLPLVAIEEGFVDMGFEGVTEQDFIDAGAVRVSYDERLGGDLRLGFGTGLTSEQMDEITTFLDEVGVERLSVMFSLGVVRVVPSTSEGFVEWYEKSVGEPVALLAAA